MTRRQDIRDQADRANDEAIQGGIDGGIRWFLTGVIVFGTAQIVLPIYRGLTLPFKTFLLSSVTAAGAVISAERRMQDYEKQVRQADRIRRRDLYSAQQNGDASRR